MTQTPDNPTSVPRWMKIALGLSLAVNLLVIGMVSGAVLRGGGPGKGPSAMNYATPYVMALPRGDRRAVFQELRSNETAGLRSRKDRRKLYTDMIAALEAEPFSIEAVAEIAQTQRMSGVRTLEVAQSAWLSRVAAMDATARKAYAQRITEVLERRKGKGQGKP